MVGRSDGHGTRPVRGAGVKRWDLILLAGVLLLVIAAGAVDWRLGAAVAGSAACGVWYWLGDAPDGEES